MAEHQVRIALKRVYEPPAPSDGVRVLVDRLWARGISKDAAELAAWMKELGPSSELRKWFGHEPARWDAFVERYRQELQTPLRQLLLAELQGVAVGSPVTLVYGARDTQENEAVVLRNYLLHEQAHPPDGPWDAPTKLLLTVAVVAAAHADAIAPAEAVTQFASPILRPRDLDRAQAELESDGYLRQSAGGWQLTTHAQQRVKRLAGSG